MTQQIEEQGWTIESDNGRRKLADCQTPIEAIEQAKERYKAWMEKHTEYCDLMRERRYYARVVDAIDETLEKLADEGYDLMPDIRVVANFGDDKEKEVLWENGETK